MHIGAPKKIRANRLPTHPVYWTGTKGSGR